jgi:aryl-alcohol dehydrogenase-like predicted oxidoreductase
MRLSTAPDRDEERAVAVLHAAFDEGVRLLDTADAYCLDDTETGHNERLIARALATWCVCGSRGHEGRPEAARRTMEGRRPGAGVDVRV